MDVLRLFCAHYDHPTQQEVDIMEWDESFQQLPDTVSANEATGLVPAAVPERAWRSIAAMQGIHSPLRPKRKRNEKGAP